MVTCVQVVQRDGLRRQPSAIRALPPLRYAASLDVLVERAVLPRRDPTELRLEDLAYGAERIGGAPIHATLRPTRGFVELPTGFIAIDRVGEANGDASRAAEALESIHHSAGSTSWDRK
jgi:hypothetical protein